MRNLFIVGHPGLYGGAATELHHQIMLWVKEFPDIKLHIIPTQHGFMNEPLFKSMVSLGITYHEVMDFSKISNDDAVINFCSDAFLSNLPKIKKVTNKIMFVNCMTFISDKELHQAQHNYISHYLYQRPQVRDDHKKRLTNAGANTKFLHFKPYFFADDFKFISKGTDKTNIGRISRADADKFAAETLHIYEYIVSPKMKQGHFLGFNQNSEKKIGKPFDWIKVYENQNALPVSEFYERVDFIVQPTNTTENWPRIGFEAMYSGVPLVVDNKGGWKFMIEHKVSGFLCDSPRDFIYWGSRLAYEPNLREDTANNALIRAESLSNSGASAESWKAIFDDVFN